MTGYLKLISRDDVVRIRMPFPNVHSGLAVKAHMYITRDNKYDLIKAQTFKASVVARVDNYLIERPNIDRNPFIRPTLIDLDKIFCLRGIELLDSLKTSIRPNVCLELSQLIDSNLSEHDSLNIPIDNFLSLNSRAELMIEPSDDL